MNLSDVVRRHAFARPSEPALTCGSVTHSWEELDHRVEGLAAWFSAEVPAGGRVTILAETCHRYFETYLALARCGRVAVPLNPRLADAEIIGLMEDAGATAAVADLANLGRDAIAAHLATMPLLAFGGAHAEERSLPSGAVDLDLAAAGDGPVDEAPSSPETLQVIGYTSGTTGRTKGSMISRAAATTAALHYAVALGVGPEDRVLACMPGYVYRGGSGGFAPLVAGARTVVAPFDGAEVHRLLGEHRITQVTLAPAMASRLLDAAGDRAARPDLEVIWLTGAPAPPRTIEGLIDRFDADVGSLYGMTEASGIAMIRHRRDRPRLFGSIGRPLPLLDVRLEDPSGSAVAPGEVGELVVRGTTVTSGYWNDPLLTEESIRDGWFRTGDMARRDGEGNLHLVDRRVDIINSGGINVYTSQVEAALLAHPAVVECAVVGAPDETWGESPVAIAVVAADPGGSLPGPEEILHWAGSRLAAFKRPREVVLVDELPRNAMGKVDKRSLREPYWSGRERRIAG